MKDIMEFTFGKKDWCSMKRGQENCFLLTNGLGGYSSLSMIGSNDRNDNALFMAALVAPNKRYHMISNLIEKLFDKDECVNFYSQQFLINREIEEKQGYLFLNSFQYKYLPTWEYQARGVEIRKTIAMVHGENTVAIRYKIYQEEDKEFIFEVTPLLQFEEKGKILSKDANFIIDQEKIERNHLKIYYQTNGLMVEEPLNFLENIYYEKDKRDGREYIGRCGINHKINFKIQKKEEEFYIIYSTEKKVRTIERIFPEAIKYYEEILNKSELENPVARRLALSSEAYVVKKDSTKGKTIVAGYPFFADWGRDTMIALSGCTIPTKEYQAAKDILKTFVKYSKKGLMPNLFPEGTEKALYNTVDASLLFFQACYDYYIESEDREFIKEVVPTLEDIIRWYENGTDFHIKMEKDGLISAGSQLEQLTWMDVRYQEILPTPRHGKPVEINAYWYNALSILEDFNVNILGNTCKYHSLREKVKFSFIEQFWMEDKGFLKDVVCCNDDNLIELTKYRAFEGRENKIAKKEEIEEALRPNQIWALSLAFSMLTKKQAQSILKIISEKLYTPYGLRTLAFDEVDYHGTYEGEQVKRDMAYHQGTVWPFPMGAYLMSYFIWIEDKEKALNIVKRKLDSFATCLEEGCLGHVAEVYDGLKQDVSKGCFAQAWSVSEILRVYLEVEKIERNFKKEKGMTNKELKKLFESKDFEKNFTYRGDDLGAIYKREETIFKVWAPTAQNVNVNFYKSGGEMGEDWIGTFPMESVERGVWHYKSKRDMKGIYYTYTFVHETHTEESIDIYAKACGINGKRGMVIDLKDTNPKDWEKDNFVVNRKEAGTIYELHIKDFSHHNKSGIREEYRGKYLAFTEAESCFNGEKNKPTCMNYLKNLGITYVHLLPFYDFGSIDETIEGNDQFNWGYDPVNYLIPEGSYATDPYRGHIRVKEVKQMIQALHNAGIGVIMDVVFNHTYSLDSAFQKAVPGYYYRMNEEGKYSNGSACGNDTASERLMYRKYMIDAICYWAEEYHLNGFRFDLMGLHDVETMNQIREALNKLPKGKELLIYGEPWSAGYSAFKKGTIPAVRKNLHLLSEGISIFADYTRDAIKGSVFWDMEPGYVNTSSMMQKIRLKNQIKNAVKGWINVEKFEKNYILNQPGDYEPLEPFYPKSPRQIITYVSAHDNYTLWDKLCLTSQECPDFEGFDCKIIAQNKMIAGIIFTSLGQVFIHAGEEFGRTKKGAGDSYNLSPNLNCLDWERAYQMEDLISYYKKLIAFRKSCSYFGCKMEEAINLIRFKETKDASIEFEIGEYKIIYDPIEWMVSIMNIGNHGSE